MRSNYYETARWFGNSDTSTSEQYYGFEWPGLVDIHREQFWRLLLELNELSRTKDANGDPLVQFIFTKFDRNCVVAFRFTSDWAERHYGHWNLVKIAPSLGRGVWRPFTEHGDETLKTWVY